jgi:predicted alpha/beta-hydrolase family hydrolase
MNSSLVSYFHSGLATHGFLTVKFNFPYAERRWRFARIPDRTEVLVDSYQRVVEETRDGEWKPNNIFLGGVPMGAAVASHVVADRADISELKGSSSSVIRSIGLGTPLFLETSTCTRYPSQ